ncbi:hypothetical protein LSTR_LSTR002594 [Laodelphax striatellus]|uniref:Uncharacterized protein n=1 Tax=Laodelphax striatellus TaxID=195883 RepID=A0A482XNB1_LAOST|nr:hypothetical protein LSTR_LSTR002594 [Laodelphax striatellus]
MYLNRTSYVSIVAFDTRFYFYCHSSVDLSTYNLKEEYITQSTDSNDSIVRNVVIGKQMRKIGTEEISRRE